MNSTWLITSELANQRARKVLFTCVVYTKCSYLLSENETPTELAEKIRAEIKEATRCTASVGISFNVLLARMCTKVAKPDGCYYLSPADDINLFMGELL